MFSTVQGEPDNELAIELVNIPKSSKIAAKMQDRKYLTKEAVEVRGIKNS